MPPRKDCAKWDDNKTEILLKICIKEIDAWNRPGTHFSKEGWKNLEKKFQEKTGCAYDKVQLKNKQDLLKKDFQSFAKLVEKETGLGWDYEKKKTFKATEEWWTTKNKEDPEILKWKQGGPKFLELLEKCFKGTIATRLSVLIPYLDPSTYEATNIGGEDTLDNIETQFNDDRTDNFEVGNEEERNAMPTPSNSSGKRKRVGKGEKKYGTAEKLLKSLDRMIDVLDRGSTTTVTRRPEDPYSYEKCLQLLNEVPNLVKGSHLYLVAMRILTIKENRIAFLHMMENDREIIYHWLGTFVDANFPQPHRYDV